MGARTRIWQFASVIRNSRIGEDCTIGSGACIDGAVIGNGTSVSHGAGVYPGAIVGERVFIGPHVACCNDRWPVASKDGFDLQRFIDGMVSVRIGDGVGIGAGAIILPGVRIGDGAMISAGAVVVQNVPDDYLLKRSGEMVPLDGRIPVRMRSC